VSYFEAIEEAASCKSALMRNESAIQMARRMSPYRYTCVNRAMRRVQRYFFCCDLAL